MCKILILVVLFVILTPGILWTYPKKTNKYSIALLHAFVFAFVLYLIETFSNTPIREGLEKNDKRLIFSFSRDVKKDKAVEEKIKRVYGNKTAIIYQAEESEKQKQKRKEKGQKIKTSYAVLLVHKNDDKSEYKQITRDNIMEKNNETINEFITANENK
jgi:hypothetical protein